jgi:23S rRNA (uracil1939-C5)-methyltransferase
MKTEVVEIEKLIFGGVGLGRLANGKIVLVPYVLPGERVKIRITAEAKDYAEAELLEVISQAKDRVEPPCPYYGTCGGCQLQHVSYQMQVELKREILIDIFQRQAGLSDVPLLGVYPSSKPFHHRNRLRLHVEASSSLGPPPFKLGFVKWKSHKVLRIEECLLAHERVNSVLKSLYHHPTFMVLSPYVKRVRIEHSPAEDKATLIFWTMIKPLSRDVESLLTIQDLKSVFYILRGARPEGPFPKDAPYGGRRLFKALFDLTYYVQPGVFVQTNWEVNLLIQQRMFDLAQGCERVLDLHAGMGNFLLPLAFKLPRGVEFLGVDTDPRVIEDGLYTAKKNNLNGRLDLRNMSSHACLHEMIKEGRTFDLVLLDPPRGGCKDLLRYLPNVAEKHILYLSCDPPTLARDVKALLSLGFDLQGLYLFDMFPQSYHLEVLAHLVKRA